MTEVQTSIQQLQVRREGWIGIFQGSETQVANMENGGEQREYRVNLLDKKKRNEEKGEKWCN